MATRSLARRLGSVQRICAMRIVSAYRTISECAVLVLASLPPFDLLAGERAEVTAGLKLGTKDKTECRRAARQRVLDSWQRRWDEADKGRWTHRLIPNLKPRVERKHGQVDYFLAQVLSGHGGFNAYLKRFARTERAECNLCGEYDDAEHAIFRCEAITPMKRLTD